MLSLPRFRRILEDDLAPLLGATVSAETHGVSAKHGSVSYVEGNQRLGIKPEPASKQRINLQREQGFDEDEKLLAEEFIKQFHDLPATSDPFLDDLLTGLMRRVISRHLTGSEALVTRLDRLDSWAAQTYEGQRITVGLGITKGEASGTIPIDDIWQEDFAPVLSNGFDTIIVADEHGDVVDFLPLNSPTNTPPFAPFRLARVAHWSSGDRVALVLNRHGEILAFSNRTLRFAKRRGRWQHYTHSPRVRQLQPPNSKKLRRTIYETALDVSYARTGGCIAVVLRKNAGQVADVVDAPDLVQSGTSIKARLFKSTINGSFPDLDRRFRQEIVALDGATVLDHTGRILAVGAIIDVNAGSTGGGRLAAAMRLSELGLGLKISADGEIRAFHDRSETFRF